MYRNVLECSESNIAVSIGQYWLNAERVDEWHTMWYCLEVIKLFFMLNSTEHEISTAHKN